MSHSDIIIVFWENEINIKDEMIFQQNIHGTSATTEVTIPTNLITVMTYSSSLEHIYTQIPVSDTPCFQQSSITTTHLKCGFNAGMISIHLTDVE